MEGLRELEVAGVRKGSGYFQLVLIKFSRLLSI